MPLWVVLITFCHDNLQVIEVPLKKIQKTFAIQKYMQLKKSRSESRKNKTFDIKQLYSLPQEI